MQKINKIVILFILILALLTSCVNQKFQKSENLSGGVVNSFYKGPGRQLIFIGPFKFRDTKHKTLINLDFSCNYVKDSTNIVSIKYRYIHNKVEDSLNPICLMEGNLKNAMTLFSNLYGKEAVITRYEALIPYEDFKKWITLDNPEIKYIKSDLHFTGDKKFRKRKNQISLYLNLL